MKPTRFDIYTRQSGRWQRAESWPGIESESALAAAASMDAKGGFDGVRVMAVVEYGSGRAPLETLSWISPHLSNVAAVKRQLRDQAMAAEKAVQARAPEAPATMPPASMATVAPAAPSSEALPPSKPAARVRPARKSAPKPPSTGIVGKLILNGTIAFAVAAVSFVPLTAIFRKLGAQTDLGMLAQQRAGAGASIIVFIVMASWLMGRVYRRHRVEFEAVAPKVQTFVAPTAKPAAAPRNLSNVAAMPYYLPEPEGDAESGPDPDKSPENDAEIVAHAHEDMPKPELRPGGGLTETMRRAMLEFLAMALAAIKDEVPRMNQHVAFGINLFGAGAAERYSEYVGLSRIQGFVLIREVIEVLGNSADRVDAFCRQFAEYAAQERYRMMIDAGRDSMSKRIDGDPAPFAGFHEAVSMWTSDTAARAQSQGIVCIMFTDIVGSTQMTHEHGDYAAQDVVRIHNAVVRSALAAHDGREVKHTGDGIMASFTSAANAVRATIEVQRALLDHKARKGSLGVNVRIGLNAGEAVQEEDDFFGTTVQLAARVCDKAGSGEIFVTENVRALAKGQGIVFSDAGQYEMKGVPQPMMLYRVNLATMSDNDANTL